eukprot:gnl/TRDRNA2_/TRDRNA2_177251_c1_seq1.p1 gnl/TRDRNA2_/TRDRNA2_177251_c1~~gnl/TRDRNA2_/TRDRNA2_177251_c1_seq1.p1  ORF type:complete len:548 (+),score=94.47 gnl/TRDRNA2_/TRDRNA2_177251_c1_seq1:98-1741(+)
MMNHNLQAFENVTVKYCDLQHMALHSQDDVMTSIEQMLQKFPTAVIMHSEGAFQKKFCVDGTIGGKEVVEACTSHVSADSLFAQTFDPNEAGQKLAPHFVSRSGEHVSTAELEVICPEASKVHRIEKDEEVYENINFGKTVAVRRLQNLLETLRTHAASFNLFFVDTISYDLDCLKMMLCFAKDNRVEEFNFIVMDHHEANVKMFHDNLAKALQETGGLGSLIAIVHLFTPGVLKGYESSALTASMFKGLVLHKRAVIDEASVWACWSDLLVILAVDDLISAARHFEDAVFPVWQIHDSKDCDEMFKTRFLSHFESIIAASTKDDLINGLSLGLIKQDTMQELPINAELFVTGALEDTKTHSHRVLTFLRGPEIPKLYAKISRNFTENLTEDDIVTRINNFYEKAHKDVTEAANDDRKQFVIAEKLFLMLGFSSNYGRLVNIILRQLLLLELFHGALFAQKAAVGIRLYWEKVGDGHRLCETSSLDFATESLGELRQCICSDWCAAQKRMGVTALMPFTGGHRGAPVIIGKDSAFAESWASNKRSKK